jgi:putative aldouronate transport system permease protein
MKYRKTPGDYIFDTINYSLLFLLMLATIYPLYYILVASLSSPAAIAKHGTLMLFPVDFNFNAYKAVFSNEMILIGYKNTLRYVVIGTSLNMIMTIFAAYALSRKWLMGRRIFMLMIVITMFFGGGLIPSFLIVQKLGLYNKFWALILPGAVGAWNIIMMRTYFMTIPDSLEESARVDGANDFHILFRIILPVSTPIIAVMILFYSVGHWNSWFGAAIYLQNRKLFPLQLILREILIQGRTADMGNITSNANQVQIAKNLKYATVIVSTVPILFVYPFLQKYFVQGIMIGSIKE